MLNLTYADRKPIKQDLIEKNLEGKIILDIVFDIEAPLLFFINNYEYIRIDLSDDLGAYIVT